MNITQLSQTASTIGHALDQHTELSQKDSQLRVMLHVAKQLGDASQGSILTQELAKVAGMLTAAEGLVLALTGASTVDGAHRWFDGLSVRLKNAKTFLENVEIVKAQHELLVELGEAPSERRVELEADIATATGQAEKALAVAARMVPSTPLDLETKLPLMTSPTGRIASAAPAPTSGIQIVR